MHITYDQWMHRTNLGGQQRDERHRADHVTVFDKYPLLGCYYVVCVDTSDVVNFMLDDMGAARWMDAVEELRRKIRPIVGNSKKLMDDARFEIENMPKIKKAEKPEKATRGDYSGFGSSQVIELE